jgi:hypothetical protein
MMQSMDDVVPFGECVSFICSSEKKLQDDVVSFVKKPFALS